MGETGQNADNSESETSDSVTEGPEKSGKSKSSKKTGVCKFFVSDKGYGFIKMDDGGEIFVHQKHIHAQGYRCLGPDEKVEFDIENQDNGKTWAINVTGPGGAFVKGDGGPKHGKRSDSKGKRGGKKQK